MLTILALASLIPAVVLHELAHAAVATWMGDPTARRAGRLSLNPIRHADLFGTLILPGLLAVAALTGAGSGLIFGYAKPVPVQPANFRHPRWQSLAVSLAGPGTNFFLAALGALALGAFGPTTPLNLISFFAAWISVNILLTAFNLFPLPPLDGSEVIAAFLPNPALPYFRALGRFGFLILFFVLFAFPNVLFEVVRPIEDFLFRVLVL